MTANRTSIAWTTLTLNTAVGCSWRGPECDGCYAALDARRRADNPMFPMYEGVISEPGVAGRKFGWSGRVNYSNERISRIARLPKGSVVFVNSMSDTFHDAIPDEHVRLLFAAMNARPDVTFQILTKRSRRAAAMAKDLSWTPNIWMGVTAGTRKMLSRLDDLREIPAAVRWLSAEPLLEGLDLRPWLEDGTLGWVVAGGESKSGFRPLDDDWVRAIRDACAANDVPFFFKQRAGYRPEKHPELDGLIHEERPSLKRSRF
jgi:protein gp37